MRMFIRLAGPAPGPGGWLLLLALLMTNRTAVADVSFEQRLIRLGEQTIRVDIADTPARQQKGLMGRHTLGENEGMLFVFPVTRARSFWMKDTLIPLSLGVFDHRRKLLEVRKLVPSEGTQQARVVVVTTPPQTHYALEVRQGWFEKNRVEPGASFDFLPP